LPSPIFSRSSISAVKYLSDDATYSGLSVAAHATRQACSIFAHSEPL